MAKWIKSKYKGLRYREHETKTTGIGRTKRPLRYYMMTYKFEGKVVSESLGWEGDYIRNEDHAQRINQQLQNNRKDKIRPYSLVEYRRMNEDVLEDQRKQEESEKQLIEDSHRFTLGALLTLYTDHLEKVGKSRSAASARSAFKVHVPSSLTNFPAKEITRAKITEIIRRVREAGKNRTAGILRAYLHAAYEVAMSAESDSAAPAAFIPFQINNNPVRGIKAIPVQAGERVLTIEELTHYLAALDDRPTDIALKVALLAGGQRMEQLLKSTPADWNQKEKTLLLYDSKGKRTTPRKHLLPLAKKAAALVSIQAERAKVGGKVFLFYSGKSDRIEVSTPGKRVRDIALALGGLMFDLRDIRRTCETHLAKIGINQDTRAQLLSHGISGVQAKHYDRYSYEKEKRTALAKWEEYLLSGPTIAEVIHLADRTGIR